jgi:flagellin-like protein
MKGITPIIAIIVLLLITVAMAGAGWTYLSGYTEGLISKQIDIVDSFCVGGNQVKIVVKNMGTGTLGTDEIVVIDRETGQALNDEIIWSGKEGQDSGLDLYMSFDSPTDVNDKSGNGNDGTVMGNAQWTPQGRFGGAFAFSDFGDYIEVFPSSYEMSNTSAAFSIWFNATNLSSGYEHIMGNANVGYNFIGAYNDRLRAEGTANSNYWFGGISVTTGRWYNLVISANSTDITTYLDGVVVDTRNCDYNITLRNIGSMYIGANRGFFNGTVDEVRIYNRPLTYEEVIFLFNNTMTLTPQETGVMTHICSSTKCNYALLAGSGSRKVDVFC